MEKFLSILFLCLLSGVMFGQSDPGFAKPVSLHYTHVTGLKESPPKFRIRSAIAPTSFGIAAGICPDTETGRVVREGCLYGAAITIGIGEKRPIAHYFINAGLSAVGFLAGRGIREISGK